MLRNTGSTTYSDIRFFHGGDTYFGGNDSARSWWSEANRMVYVNNAFTLTGYMGFYASPTPRQPTWRPLRHRLRGMDAGQLSSTTTSTFLDAGYAAVNRPRWRRDRSDHRGLRDVVAGRQPAGAAAVRTTRRPLARPRRSFRCTTSTPAPPRAPLPCPSRSSVRPRVVGDAGRWLSLSDLRAGRDRCSWT